MSTVTRDEFETVKQLLASAARYAESANQKLDRVATQQETNTTAIADLRETQERTQQQLDQLSQKQDRTQTQLDQLSVRVTQMSERVDSFVFESQRLHSQHAEKIEQLKGISERLEAILAYLVRKDGGGE
jgi:uncharacterized protein (DUF3084 family)